ncbi:hypothetical protein QZH41_005744 [Actinostola sp. cb2023]|nr:hypothetical protein QZH41_005744 [Actinostola sp. cb2023]
MLHCSAKSALMTILVKLGGELELQRPTTGPRNSVHERMDVEPSSQLRVAVVDAMAELQSLDKPEPDAIKDYLQLAEHFSSTRVKRQAGQDPVHYRITNSTHIAKVRMRRLLSHTKTKNELTSYLAEKFIGHAEKTKLRVVVAWGCTCRATHQDVDHLQSYQEEADTKMLLHALDATANGATELFIHSPDTDVLVLSLRRYPELCEKTSFVTGTGDNHRVIELDPIASALGSAKLAALPAFHALSGADSTGSFSGKGKLACWKAFRDADQDVISALGNLGTTLHPAEETVTLVEKYVCQLYQPRTSISQVKHLRWQMFRKNQAQSDRLPPTQSALYEAILRAHYQIWQATLYPRFINISFEKAALMLGSNGAWPRENPPPERHVESAKDIPANFDARQQWPGSIHAIRNQGQCGSCWAFGASETLSDRFAIASRNRINVILSAQQLVDCDTDNTGCKGGWPINAWNYMVKVGQLDERELDLQAFGGVRDLRTILRTCLLTEQCYGPYYAIQYQCKVTANTTQCPGQPGYPTRFYHAKNAYKLPPRNIPAMQTDIMTYGPIEGAKQWLQQTKCDFPMFVDDDRKLYRALGLKRSVFKVWSTSALIYYAEQKRKGRKLVGMFEEDDPTQMGGDFVMDCHEFREAFSIFDVDGSGTITVDELEMVMKNLGEKVDRKELEQMVNEVDEDGSGEIEFEEFCEMMSKKMQQEEEEGSVLDAFNEWDESGKGMIKVDEFKSMLKKLREVRLTNSDVEQMVAVLDPAKKGEFKFEEMNQVFKMFDKDGDGTISTDELEEVMTSIGENAPSRKELDDMVNEVDKEGKHTPI